MEQSAENKGRAVKRKPPRILKLIEHGKNKTLSREILKKPTGSITARSFAAGKGLKESISAYDTYIHLIDGSADIIIGNETISLLCGQAILVPARKFNQMKSTVAFKIMMTVIKTNYETKPVFFPVPEEFPSVTIR